MISSFLIQHSINLFGCFNLRDNGLHITMFELGRNERIKKSKEEDTIQAQCNIRMVK